MLGRGGARLRSRRACAKWCQIPARCMQEWAHLGAPGRGTALALVSSMLRTTVPQVAPSKYLFLALFASLGVLPLACGGTSTRHNGNGNGSDNGDSGSAGTSGSSSV